MILITGATGHIGNVLVRELLERGHALRALVLPGEDCSPLDGLAVELVEGDILKPETLGCAFCGVDTVFHLAGIISLMKEDLSLMERVNVQGTRNVIAACRDAGVKRLVHTSSIHAFQRVPCGQTVDENYPFDVDNAVGAYDRTKAMGSLEVLQAAREGMDAVIVCPTGVIGPYDYRLSEMGRLITGGLRSGVQFCIKGAYDFVDVRDVARGMALAGEKGRAGEVYILSGQPVALPLLLQLVGEVTGRAMAIINIPLSLARAAVRLMPLFYRLTRSRPLFTSYSLETITGNCAFSNEKAVRELGYSTRSLRETVTDTVQWFLANRRVWVKA